MINSEMMKIDRNEFINQLKQRSIGTGIHFIALHLHRYYREKFGFKRGDFPESEWISDRTISLPLSAKLSEADIYDVIEAVREVVRSYRR
jgi:dTDP-4-amino-4,6-dideoxygalactose transaminase